MKMDWNNPELIRQWIKEWREKADDVRKAQLNTGLLARAAAAGPLQPSSGNPAYAKNLWKDNVDGTMMNLAATTPALTIDNPKHDKVALALTTETVMDARFQSSSFTNVWALLCLDNINYHGCFLKLEIELDAAATEKIPALSRISNFKQVNFPDAICDPAANPSDLNTSRFFFEREYIDRTKLAAELGIEDETVLEYAGEKIGYSIVGEPRNQFNYVFGGANIILGQDGAPIATEANLWSVGRPEQKITGTETGECVRWTLFVRDYDLPNEWRRIRFLENDKTIGEYEHGIIDNIEFPYPILPYCYASNAETPGMLQSMTLFGQVMPAQQVLLWDSQMGSDNIELASRPILLTPEENLLFEQQDGTKRYKPFKLMRGTIIPLRSGTVEKTRWLETKPIPADAWKRDEQVKYDIQGTTGNTYLQQGVGKESGAPATAHEVSLIEDITDKMTGKAKRALIEMLKDLGRKVACVISADQGSPLTEKEIDVPLEFGLKDGSRSFVMQQEAKFFAAMDRISDLIQRFPGKYPEIEVDPLGAAAKLSNTEAYYSDVFRKLSPQPTPEPVAPPEPEKLALPRFSPFSPRGNAAVPPGGLEMAAA